MIKKAKAMFANQLRIESSYQIKCQNFFQYSLICFLESFIDKKGIWGLINISILIFINKKGFWFNMRRFCPNCGKNIEEGTFCSECTPKKLKYEVPSIQVSEYNRTWHKNSWKNFNDLEELIISRVQESLKKKIPIIVDPFEFKYQRKFKIDVLCHANIDDVEVDLPVKLSYRQCDMGEKEKAQYFEGILQLRNTNETIFEFIQSELKKVARKGIFVMKEVPLTNGVDLYLTNKNYLKILANNLGSKFGADVSINAQLFSRNHLTSKDIYRVNAVVTFLNFNIGDVVKFNYSGSKRTKVVEHFMLVKKLGKLVQGYDLLNGKSVAFEAKYMKTAKKLEEVTTQVVSLDPLQVLDENYQPVEVINSIPKDLDIDDKVLIVKTKIGIFIIGYPLHL